MMAIMDRKNSYKPSAASQFHKRSPSANSRKSKSRSPSPNLLSLKRVRENKTVHDKNIKMLDVLLSIKPTVPLANELRKWELQQQRHRKSIKRVRYAVPKLSGNVQVSLCLSPNGQLKPSLQIFARKRSSSKQSHSSSKSLKSLSSNNQPSDIFDRRLELTDLLKCSS